MDRLVDWAGESERQSTQMLGADFPIPLPSVGIDSYHAEREACLNADPKKHANYQRYLMAKKGLAAVDYLPIKIDIENVSRCNFRCTMCSVSDWHKGKRAEDMPFEAFKTMLDEQFGLVEIKIQGLGEPTMQGDDLLRMIRHARQKRIWVRTVTNASRLHLKDFYKPYVDTGVNEIQVSIDGATAEVFESIRRQSDFSRVTKNCRALNDYTHTQGKRITKMWTLVQEANRHQLLDLVDLAADLGFQDLAYSFTLIGFGDKALQERNDAVETEYRYRFDVMQNIMERAQSDDIRVGFWLCDSKYSTRSAETRCAWPFERAMVTSDLRVVPCCTISNPDAFEFEPGTGKSLTEIWQGKTYTEFRQAHIDGRIPEVCRACYRD